MWVTLWPVYDSSAARNTRSAARPRAANRPAGRIALVVEIVIRTELVDRGDRFSVVLCRTRGVVR